MKLLTLLCALALATLAVLLFAGSPAEGKLTPDVTGLPKNLDIKALARARKTYNSLAKKNKEW